MQLNLPAQSLFGKEEGDNRPLQAYARYLAANNAQVEQFITRLKFDVSVANPKLFFKPMRWLVDSEYAVTQAKGTTDDAVRAVTMTVSQMDKVAPAAPAKKVAKVVAPVQEPADDDPPPPAPPAAATEAPSTPKKGRGRPKKPAAPVESPAPEPVLKTTPTAPTLPERKDVASVAAQWGEDD